ncbi:conserved Plasmodium protein, unknown function [Plasmodium ovale wallikeri]|uniref:Uncharacterized protein n=2 Tax=Plasmodium ovale TaxID=36330 RepID=A0A1A8Z726_PLAOA|nr:conserved Plasmodium protein, unknown function [Plasmodium ovale wallikeri]SBT39738.1 conserved Plasmodium protein, unknown function [Plasmodium ovale wallikeri]SBT77858.1 conserved Plasmodium protein, unknown function [Plasmodium ovale]
MNNASTIASNESVQFQKPIVYKNRARSLMQQSIKSGSENHDRDQSNGNSIRDKIRRLFSSKYDQSIRELQKTKLKMNKEVCEEDKSCKNVETSPSVYDKDVEWQPVYRETCKIKLPVEDYSTKVSLPKKVVDDWVRSQNKFSKELGASRGRSEQSGSDHGDDGEHDPDGNSNEEKANSKGNFLFNTLTQGSRMRNNEEEPYSKFKYYYNYYLVDEYLESLAESQNKKLDATGLDENGQLYDNVSLHIKPLITSKQRLENGVPYDPQKLLK